MGATDDDVVVVVAAAVAKRRYSMAAAKACRSSLKVSSVHPEKCSTLFHPSTDVGVSSVVQSKREEAND